MIFFWLCFRYLDSLKFSVEFKDIDMDLTFRADRGDLSGAANDSIFMDVEDTEWLLM